jgi:integrase
MDDTARRVFESKEKMMLTQFHTSNTDIRTLPVIGQAANQAASDAVFRLYQDRRPINTQRSQRAALDKFAEFLRFCGIAPAGDLYENPQAWHGVTWGLAQAFQNWLLQNGYSVKTVNDRVSVIKVYMSLGNQAGIIPDGEILRLQGLKGFSKKEAKDLDAKRTAEGYKTRTGAKKSMPTPITEEQVTQLSMVRNDTPQARRDALIICLLHDHAMRVSEVEDLQVENIDRTAKQVTFYRRKTGKTSIHNLRGRCWRILSEYLSKDNQAVSGPLILASNKTGKLLKKGMTTRAITDRVALLGQGIGIEKLSSHDLRHAAATVAGCSPDVSISGLMNFGGWESANVAVGYMNRRNAENDGVSIGVD